VQKYLSILQTRQEEVCDDNSLVRVQLKNMQDKQAKSKANTKEPKTKNEEDSTWKARRLQVTIERGINCVNTIDRQPVNHIIAERVDECY
jgi:hypothetical protein